MDVFHMTVSGWVGKVHGWRTVKNNQVFRFSMATHRPVGSSQDTLWLNVSLPDPICNIAAERGLYVGEQVLIMSAWAELAAVIQGTVAKPFLNVTATNLIFLTQNQLPALERAPGILDRSENIIDYSLLMQLKSERVG